MIRNVDIVKKDLRKQNKMEFKTTEEISVMDYTIVAKKEWISKEDYEKEKERLKVKMLNLIIAHILNSERINQFNAEFDDKCRKEQRKRNKEEPTTLIHIYLEQMSEEVHEVFRK